MTKIQDITAGHSLRNLFGQSLVKYANDFEFVCFSADCAGGTGAYHFRDKYPKRFYQMGIAEQATMAAAAGYSMASGLPVVVDMFATFSMRAWEIFRLSVAYNNANVKLVLSHVGLDTGPDSVSGASLEHYAVWRCIPGVEVIHPATPIQMEQAVKWMLTEPGPVVMFTGRSNIPDDLPHLPFWLHEPNLIQNSIAPKATVVVAGGLLGEAIKACKDLPVDLFLVSSFSKLNTNDIALSVLKSKRLFTVEDAALPGGLGEMIRASLAGVEFYYRAIGVNGWGQSGEGPELWQHYKMDAEHIRQYIKAKIK